MRPALHAGAVRGHRRCAADLAVLIPESREAAPPVDVTVSVMEHGEDLAPILLSPADVVLVDGHGWLEDGRPAVDGLDLTLLGRGVTAPVVVLGCCGGGSQPFVNALERTVERPVALLACESRAPYEHGPGLFSAVRAVLATRPGPLRDADEGEALLRDALAVARAAEPRRDWGRWRPYRLRPLPT